MATGSALRLPDEYKRASNKPKNAQVSAEAHRIYPQAGGPATWTRGVEQETKPHVPRDPVVPTEPQVRYDWTLHIYSVEHITVPEKVRLDP